MFLKIGILAIAGVVLLVLLKNNASVFAIMGEITLVVVIIMAIVPEINNLLSVMDDLQGVSSVGEGSLKIMFKAFGILCVGGITADICRDNGENAVAGVVELSMKILAISCALPVFSAVTEIALAFFNR